MRNLIASAMLGVLLAVLGATAAVAQPIKIVAFGGSSTYGQGLERCDAYPAKLEGAAGQGLQCRPDQRGVSGDKTADGLRRLDRAVPADSQIVIVEYGINDHFAKNDPQAIRANLDAMLARLRGRGAQVLLVGYFGSQGLETLARKYDAG